MNEEQDFKGRLALEIEELTVKLDKLNQFLLSDPDVSDKQLYLLSMQMGAMTTYLGILGLRHEDLN